MPNVTILDIAVRWGDLDAFNHVNNTLFLRYLEEARIEFFDGLGDDWNTDEHGPVVVNVNCNFRREIRYPATVRVRLEAEVASEKRLLMKHTMTDPDDPETLYADAEITAVWIEKSTGQSIPVPQGVRDTLAS